MTDFFHVLTKTLSILFCVSQYVIVLLWHLIHFSKFHIVNSINLCIVSCHHYTAVGEPTNMTVTPGENSIFFEWSPPSEGSPLSYTVTWTGRGVTSSHVLPPTARNYTIRGLDSNTAYSGTVQVSDNTTIATVPWNEYTLPQGELMFQSSSKAVNSRSDISFKLYIVCFTFATIHTLP